jgi:hypothetical protein
MYGRTTSAGNESMNQANQRARERTAVDLVNAKLLLVNLENERFARKRDLAWNSNDILTPKGKLLRDEALKDFNVNNYAIEVEEIGEHFANYLVRKAGPNNKTYKLQFPLVERMDSRFGSCTCGFPKVMGVPFKHMVPV